MKIGERPSKVLFRGACFAALVIIATYGASWEARLFLGAASFLGIVGTDFLLGWIKHKFFD
jgi:hypothetical protein